MKDETIRPGDLVMVVKGTACCNNLGSCGKLFTVSYLSANNYVYCLHCGVIERSIGFYASFDDGHTCETYRLKKIHPPELPETVDERQEVAA